MKKEPIRKKLYGWVCHYSIIQGMSCSCSAKMYETEEKAKKAADRHTKRMSGCSLYEHHPMIFRKWFDERR